MAGRDPSGVAGGGVERLRAAGVAVDIGEGAAQAAALNAAFLWSTVRPERPFVALKLATSLDGFIADHAGCSQWITGVATHEWTHVLRAGFDAVAVGRGTAVADDPQLTARGSIQPRVPPARVVFAGRGDLPATLRCFGRDVPGAAFAVVHPDVHAVRARVLEPMGVQVLAAAAPADALAALRERGIRALLVEGGSRFGGGLLDAGLVDRVYRLTAPRFLGRGTAAFGTERAVHLDDAANWAVTERQTLGDDSLLVVDRGLCLPAS
jgi:diaminohydroxyphosphoribosylaminopyrimidine deaminase/5-amino-6-(5-phosphoribosylamino)uracil reductase